MARVFYCTQERSSENLESNSPQKSNPWVTPTHISFETRLFTCDQPRVDMEDARMHRRTAALQRLLLSGRGSTRKRAARTAASTPQEHDDLQFLIMSSMRNGAERAVLQRRTWCQQLANPQSQCAFVLADTSEDGGRYVGRTSQIRVVSLREQEAHVRHGHAARPKDCCTNASTLDARAFFCERHRMQTLDAQYRYLPALRFARNELEHTMKHIRWIALIDDDSFVFPRGLRRVLRQYDASLPFYLGDFWREPLAGGGGAESALGKPEYACGGGGSIFSRGALLSMDVAGCIEKLHATCSQSDWMIGQCARAAGLRFVPEHGCTCIKWHGGTERLVRNRLRSGSCSFLQLSLIHI